MCFDDDLVLRRPPSDISDALGLVFMRSMFNFRPIFAAALNVIMYNPGTRQVNMPKVDGK